MEISRLKVRVTPRASRNEIAAWDGDVVRVRVTAPPVEGKANEALLRLLAERLSLARSSLRIVQGLTSRDKVVEVTGLGPDEVSRRLST
jgi:uncharacterized protein (TIGR00251 family)